MGVKAARAVVPQPVAEAGHRPEPNGEAADCLMGSKGIGEWVAGREDWVARCRRVGSRYRGKSRAIVPDRPTAFSQQVQAAFQAAGSR